jgi:hypothetical protein
MLRTRHTRATIASATVTKPGIVETLAELLTLARSGAMRLRLTSSRRQSYLDVRFAKAMARERFEDWLTDGAPAVFVRRLLTARFQDAVYAYQVGLEGDETETEILIREATEEEAPPADFHLRVYGFDARDVAAWSCIDSDVLLTETILGSRAAPTSLRVTLERTGSVVEVSRQWAGAVATASMQDACSVFPLDVQFSAGEHTAEAHALLGETGNSVGRWTGEGRLAGSEAAELHRVVEEVIDARVSLRLRRKIKVFVEVETPSLSLDPLGFAARQHSAVIKAALGAAVSRALDSSATFAAWCDGLELMLQAREASGLARRKVAARAARAVVLKKGNCRLFREPQNEQEVVLLCVAAMQHKLLPVFDLLDYDTHQGVDAVARVQLLKQHVVDEDATVEFKYRLEQFLDDRHPIDLVDLVVCWSVNRKLIERAGWMLVGSPEPWRFVLRRPKSDKSVQVVVLSLFQEIAIVSD